MHDDDATFESDFDPDAARAAYERGRQILTETPLRTVPVAIAPPREVAPAAPQPMPPIPLDSDMLSVSIIDRARLTISNLPRIIMNQYKRPIIATIVAGIAFGVKQFLHVEVPPEVEAGVVTVVAFLWGLHAPQPDASSTVEGK